MALETAEIVLASQSPSRAALLRAAGLTKMRISAPRIDEEAVRARGDNDARKLSLELARHKASIVSAREDDAYVIGADQILVQGGRLYSKAANMEEARQRLRLLRGRAHELYGGTALVRSGRLLWSWRGQLRMEMRDFSDDFLETYLEEEGEKILSSVGCYCLEGAGVNLFSQMDGDYFSILGLPLLPLLAALRREGALLS